MSRRLSWSRPVAQELCGCSRLAALEAGLVCFNSCLEAYVVHDPHLWRGLLPGCLPALRTLSLHLNEHDQPGGHPAYAAAAVPLPDELSVLTQLTSLHVRGLELPFVTLGDWQTDHYDTLHLWDRREDPDAETLEQESRERYLDWVLTVSLPKPSFWPPRLRELSLLDCCPELERVPEFVTGLRTRWPVDAPGLPTTHSSQAGRRGSGTAIARWR